MTALGADEIIRLLGLEPHVEGGFYRQTFRAADLPLPLPERGVRAASTAIYYLLRRGDFSAFHRVRSDEVWHYYAGAPLELHLLEPRAHTVHVLGPELSRGERPQHVVPAGVLQAARLAPGGARRTEDFALVGCTVAPGFDFADFEVRSRAALVSEFPEHRALLEELTRA